MADFYRINQLPQYIFNRIADMKIAAKNRGEDVIDFGMGNPDQATPVHVVDSLINAVKKPENHRYSLSRGILELRLAISKWYQRQFNVEIDPEHESIVTIGSKEGIAHLALAIMAPGEVALVPSPAYPIHTYAFIIAGAIVKHVPLAQEPDALFENIKQGIEESNPKPKILILNFPSNPTTQCVDLKFFKKIIELAKKHSMWVLHDLAYADIVFDGYRAPSILEVSGAKEVAIECYTLSKSYNMPGWRVGFMCGNPQLIAALAKMKSYLDYGMFAPIQIAAISALESTDNCVQKICDTYKLRRNLLCSGLKDIKWEVETPKASMFVWAKIPEKYRELGSLSFAEQLLLKANVAVSPGVGFGPFGDDHVRFSLIEEENRIEQAVLRIKKMFDE